MPVCQCGCATFRLVEHRNFSPPNPPTLGGTVLRFVLLPPELGGGGATRWVLLGKKTRVTSSNLDKTTSRIRGTTPEIEAAARRLRTNLTQAEQILWQALKGKQLNGLRDLPSVLERIRCQASSSSQR